MKRTPLWVFVAAVGIQIAALGLCIWAMEDFGHLEDDADAAPEAKPVPPAPAVLNPAPDLVSAEVAFARQPAPEPAAAAPPQAPLFGPPPARMAEPESDFGFLTDESDASSQLLRGEASGRTVAFGFYADGNIRFVDVDGGRYAGKADSARARMREVEGTRAFTVQIGVAADGGLAATFTGGLHDAETLGLEPLVGRSVA
ncbi:MAG: hypothetical protein JWO85_1063 [Candidatus Eremiobacteraeota bacterium]|nr:hypothetical protein [Candidatus Eremiobacteraeota bacterium]